MVEKFCEHIEKLLAQHDYVVVPNLGGFVVQIQSAQLLPDRITPPHATVAFNPLMHHADGLLAIEIARSEKISYRMAMEYIEKEVESIKLKLNITESIRFGNLGIIYKNETGTLIFTPNSKADFLPNNFQLSDLYVSTKSLRYIENKRKITITMPSSHIFKYVAAAMVVFGLFFVSPRVNDMQQTNNAGLATISFKSTPKHIEHIKPIVVKIDTDSVKITNNDIFTKKVKEEETPEIKSNFYVIVASSSTKASAERYCKELAASEFPDAQVLPPSKTYRVAIQTFSNRDEAIQYMEKLRQTDSRFETAWVLCN